LRTLSTNPVPSGASSSAAEPDDDIETSDAIEPPPEPQYICHACYPSPKHSMMLGRKNLHLFRLHNTSFDMIGGVLYFLIVVSVRMPDVSVMFLSP
jgi:hypothetical protein